MKPHTSPRKRSLARLLLYTEAIIIFIFFAIFLAEYLRARRIDPLYANSYYSTVAEHLIGSLVISLASAAWVDRLEQAIEHSS